MKLFLNPDFDAPDNGDGGIRRVVEAQKKWIPILSNGEIEFTRDIYQADIVACHAGQWVDPVKKNASVVAHCHGLYWAEYAWPKWARQLNGDVIAALRKADYVTTPSHWVAYALQRGMNLEPTVLHHGIDVEDWYVTTDPSDYVLWNKTRIDPICEVDSLYELARRRPNVHFISTLGEEAIPNIHYTGVVVHEDAKKYVQNALVYLCTTRETFGIGTLEAMAAGVPVLGWNWGGQREIITQQVDGFLVGPGDFDGLAAGLDYILEHREEMSLAARRTAEKFTWQKMMQGYVDLYNRAYKEANRQKPRVSVLIPCYNMQDTIVETIESVQRQTLKDVEIVVVDDCSTDNSAQVVQELKSRDDRIVITQTPENLYLSGALNWGMGFVKSDKVIPLDADNMLGSDETLEILANALDSRNIDIAYGAMKVILPDGSPNKNIAPDGVSGWPQDFDFRLQMMHRNQIPSTSMYKRKVWDRSGGYRRRCRTAEDADFWCRVSSLGFVPKKVTDAVTLIYRDRPDSMSHVEEDWDWTAWYPWSREWQLTPFGVPQSNYEEIFVPSYEPAWVNVVIPVGPGHGELLIDAIDSVAAQTFQKWTITVVNDSGEILPHLPPYVRVLRTPSPKSGPSVARNIGVAAVNTRTFIFLDADDYLQPSALELMYEEWKAHPKSYIYSDFFKQESGEAYITPEYDCKELLRKMPHAVTALYPRAGWNEVGGIDTTIELWEDWDFVIALNAAGYCGIRVGVPLFHYRMEAGMRRNELYDKREELRNKILTKWHDYYGEGAKDLAGCGCGGGSEPSQLVSQMQAAMQQTIDRSSNDLVLVEFIKPNTAPLTYRGQSTGTMYRFSSESDERIHYVHAADVSALLEHPEFQLVKERTVRNELLVASGPPTR